MALGGSLREAVKGSAALPTHISNSGSNCSMFAYMSLAAQRVVRHIF